MHAAGRAVPLLLLLALALKVRRSLSWYALVAQGCSWAARCRRSTCRRTWMSSSSRRATNDVGILHNHGVLSFGGAGFVLELPTFLSGR